MPTIKTINMNQRACIFGKQSGRNPLWNVRSMGKEEQPALGWGGILGETLATGKGNSYLVNQANR